MKKDFEITGNDLKSLLLLSAKEIESQKDYLCELDSEVGDGDHGVTMTIAMRAVKDTLEALNNPTPSEALRAVSEAFADEVGASVGPLYEVAFSAAGDAIDGQDSIKSSEDWAKIFAAIVEAMQQLGGAQIGDKTLIDAWGPAAAAAKQNINEPDVVKTLKAAVDAAANGVESTIELIPKRGRASLLGERARGFKDAGASSAYIFLNTLQKGVERLYAS